MIIHTEELTRKAKMLKESKFFVNNTDEGKLSEKQSIFLVLAGQKPLSDAISGQWTKTANTWNSLPENLEELGNFLTELGLAFHLSSDEHLTHAVVALDQAAVERFIGPAPLNVGIALGYPKTAVEAFDRKECLDSDRQDALMRTAGLPLFMPQFCLSKNHYAEELEVLKAWHSTLAEYGLV